MIAALSRSKTSQVPSFSCAPRSRRRLSSIRRKSNLPVEPGISIVAPAFRISAASAAIACEAAIAPATASVSGTAPRHDSCDLRNIRDSECDLWGVAGLLRFCEERARAGDPLGERVADGKCRGMHLQFVVAGLVLEY